MESIKEFGFKVPIIIDKNNVVVAGHTRLKAAKKLKMTEVPCIVADDLSDEQIKAFRLADNKVSEFAEWDMELLSQELETILELDISKFGFEKIEQEKDPDEVIEDEPPAPPITPKSKYGDIYQLGKHRLMCGDSTKAEDVEKLMNGEKADLVVTDPPYGVNYSQKNEYLNRLGKGNRLQTPIHNDYLGDSSFQIFLENSFSTMKNALKDGGVYYIWYAATKNLLFETALNKIGLTVKQQLIWVKNNHVLGMSDYQWKHEPCIYGWKQTGPHYFISSHSQFTVIENKNDFNKMSKKELIEVLERIFSDDKPTTVIHEAKPLKSDLHPTMKPINLIARLINNSSRKNELVLDLFGGSGSTLIAAEQMNRRCYMMEYDPQYVDVIIERWENLTGEKAVKLE